MQTVETFRRLCKMSSSKKNWPVKGLCGRCLSVWGPEPHHTPPYTLYTCIHYIHTGRGWGGKFNQREGRGATVHKAGSKIPTCLTVSLVYKLWLTPAAKSLYGSIFLDGDILLWCFFIKLVHDETIGGWFYLMSRKSFFMWTRHSRDAFFVYILCQWSPCDASQF